MYDLTKLTDSADLAMIGKVTCNGKGDGMTVEGNPDVAYADGSTVYIHLGYQGLLVIDTATAFAG